MKNPEYPKFADVILPLAVADTYTYAVPPDMGEQLVRGMRVVVQFGASGKYYTGIVGRIHDVPPGNYEARSIDALLDDEPMVNDQQLKLWKWMHDYYLCKHGDAMSAALPGGLVLTSETKVLPLAGSQADPKMVDDREFMILEALEVSKVLTLKEIGEILNLKTIQPIIKGMLSKGLIVLEEEIKEKYRPRIKRFVELTDAMQEEARLAEEMDAMIRAPKQLNALMKYLQLSGKFEGTEVREVDKLELQKTAEVNATTVNELVKKKVFRIVEREVGRLGNYEGNLQPDKELNDEQEKAYTEISDHFTDKDTVLLHGVTASGKTEVYVKLIREVLDRGQQVLFLVPEIALTTQIINRMRSYFGDRVGVYHSRFSSAERIEVWMDLLKSGRGDSGRFDLVIGPRSALFLPFHNLGLVIVDEEHDSSYKQFDPAPRYQGRDVAIVLAQLHKAKVLLGSATPSIESSWNAQQGKYGLVTMSKRFGGVMMPEIQCVDIKEAYKKKKMKSHFSESLIQMLTEALEAKEQVIIFQNRRGYAPFLMCDTCGNAPQCKNCDVSLTYHKFKNELSCHYCGYKTKMPTTCPSCGDTHLAVKGFGTEKIEEELQLFFPEATIRRMDWDSTRTKNAYQNIISDFESKAIDILVGTQMVTKGLDFENVGLVSILNADQMLNFPDFRSFERSYQLMAQVSGRAGRKKKRGKVLLQTFNPYHQIIRDVIENNYSRMYGNEIIDRRNFKYPPFYRLIDFTLKHSDAVKVRQGAREFAAELKQVFGDRLLGPEAPAIARVRNKYHQKILLKVERNASLRAVKMKVMEKVAKFESQSTYKAVRIVIDVDPM